MIEYEPSNTVTFGKITSLHKLKNGDIFVNTSNFSMRYIKMHNGVFTIDLDDNSCNFVTFNTISSNREVIEYYRSIQKVYGEKIKFIFEGSIHD